MVEVPGKSALELADTWESCLTKIEDIARATQARTASFEREAHDLPRARSHSEQLGDILEQITHLRRLADAQRALNANREHAQSILARAGFTFHYLSREYLLRLAFALISFFVALYVNTLASVVAGYRTPWIEIRGLDGQSTGRATLPDVGHDLCAAIIRACGLDSDAVGQWLEANGFLIPDVLVNVMMGCTTVFVLCHPKRFQIMRRVLLIMAFVFLLRAMCVFVTQLPDAHPRCQAQFTSSTGMYKRRPMFPRAFFRAWTVLWSPTSHVTCGDMVFSAHTTVLTQCAMTVFYYCRPEELPGGPVFTMPLVALSCNRFALTERFFRVARACTILYASVGAALIIATRLHYTLDVALAVYLNVRSFRWYHDAASYDQLKKRKSIFLLGYGSVMLWFEAEEVMAVEAAAMEVVSSAQREKQA